MDVFNRYPPTALARVTEDLASTLAQNALVPLAGWSESEWALAPQTAFVLGIGPLLHSRFSSKPEWLQLPNTFREALTRQYRLNDERIQRILHEWQQVLHLLSAAEVSVMPLKGLALIRNYYSDSAMRPLADLDILIHPNDSSQTRAALASLGYVSEDQSAKSNFVRADNRQPVCMDAEHPDNPRRIEVHTRVQDEFRGTTVDWTARAWATSHVLLPFPDAREMDAATLFTHLFSHTSRDVMTCRARLIQLHDIALIAQILTEQNLWSNVLVARDRRTARFFYPALALVNRHFPHALPQTYCQKVREQTPPRLRAWCDRQTLFDVSWLGGNHIGVWQTLRLWSQSPREVMQMSQVMWERRTLRVGHMFPQLRRSRWFFIAYLGYAWDQLRGSRHQLQQRGRWDFADVPDDAPTPL